MIQPELITKQREIDRLVPEWKALWRRLHDATPFQSPEWLLSWWQSFGTGAPAIVTVRGSGELAGVLPLYLLDEPGCCKLLPIGISLSDCLDALVDPESLGAADAMLATIAGIPRWDECHLPCLSPDAPVSIASCPPGLTEFRSKGDTHTMLPLPSELDRRDDVFPRKKRQNLRRARRRLALIGDPRFEMADDTRMDEVLHDLFRLHGIRWRQRGEPGVCEDPVVQEFHLTAARQLLGAGMLRLYALRLDGATLAAFYCFTANSIAYAYLNGFDLEYEELSPGTQLLAHAIEMAVVEGAREFHFLRGDEPHKFTWNPAVRTKITRTFRRRC